MHALGLFEGHAADRCRVRLSEMPACGNSHAAHGQNAFEIVQRQRFSEQVGRLVIEDEWVRGDIERHMGSRRASPFACSIAFPKRDVPQDAGASRKTEEATEADRVKFSPAVPPLPKIRIRKLRKSGSERRLGRSYRPAADARLRSRGRLFKPLMDTVDRIMRAAAIAAG